MTFQGMLPGGLSSDAYLDRRLRLLDAEHYSAAGLLPYRRSGGAVEVLVTRERPWNSFSQAYDPISWNFFGGKRVPRLERSVELTAVRSFSECAGEVPGAPSQDDLFKLMKSGFEVWYPVGKFGLVLLEVPSGELEELPAAYQKFKSASGPAEEFRILPQGIKKWSKMIDEIAWVSGSKLTAENAEVSDLVQSMVNIPALREFLNGVSDPAKTLPEGDAVVAPRPGKGGGRGGRGKGKGGYGVYDGGFGKGFPKGYDQGMMMGMPPQMPQQMPMMYAGQGKGMSMMAPMAPMVFPQMPDQNSAGMQRQIFGEQLYVLVQPMAPSPNLAQKITGMLLELPQNELMINLTNRDELQRRVSEALEVLREDGVTS